MRHSNMGLRKIFLNEYGRLRSGFRFLIFVFAFIFITLAVTTAMRAAYAGLHDAFPRIPYAEFFQNLIGKLPDLLAALIGGYLCTRVLEGLPWRALGLTLHKLWARDFLIGSAIGISSLVLAAIIAIVGGGLKLSLNTVHSPGRIAIALIGSAMMFIFAALAEEATFRGYPLQTFTRARLALLGVLLTSVPFALGHLWNPNVVPGVTFANTALAGFWLALAYLRTRSLWLPLGVHWAWNWAMGSFFGLPVSGLHLVGATFLKADDVGPAWLTGGTYGLEGGVACTVALVVSTIVIWKLPFVSATPELVKLTSEERPVRGTLGTAK
jgi:membrane protease YdiL (CAAX protease family)